MLLAIKHWFVKLVSCIKFLPNILCIVSRFDVTARSWSIVDAKPVPKARFGHSMVFYNVNI